MALYQEILFLKYWFNGKYVVENVVPYYEPLVPAQKMDRHLWWANFTIPYINIKRPFPMDTTNISDLENFLGICLDPYDLDDKRKSLRNCVIPQTGKYILDCAIEISKEENLEQLSMNL